MANRENRVKKLEEKTPKGRWVYPRGYYYSEKGCEPYWTDEPVKPFASMYEEIEKKTGIFPKEIKDRIRK